MKTFNIRRYLGTLATALTLSAASFGAQAASIEFNYQFTGTVTGGSLATAGGPLNAFFTADSDGDGFIELGDFDETLGYDGKADRTPTRFAIRNANNSIAFPGLIAGTSTASTLTVDSVGNITGGSVTLNASTPGTINGDLALDVDAGTWTLKAGGIVQSSGTGVFAQVAVPVPDAPTGLSATPGDGQATVAFTPGDDYGVAITNYEYSLDGGPYTALNPVRADSPITIAGLANGTPYSITLRAINSLGSGNPSDAVETTPAAAPAAPTGLSAAPGDSQVTISFTPGADNGAAITNYEYSLNGGSYTALSSATAGSPIIIAGLTNGTPYSITLRAINSSGSGNPSDAVETTPLAAPDAPTGLLQQGEADDVATIAFAAGADNGAAITNYAYSLDGGLYTALDPAQDNSPITITGLTNGTPYSITLRAINSAGNSASSVPIVVTPGQPAVVTPPDAPTGLSATPGDGQVTITFTPGPINGAAITNYAYSLDGVGYAASRPSQANSPITITGLTNGTPYSITLKAINSAGDSVVASMPVVTTPVGPPAPPPGPAAPIPTMSAYGLGLTVLGVFVVAVRRLRTLAKPK
jgi:hypothetical protein